VPYIYKGTEVVDGQTFYAPYEPGQTQGYFRHNVLEIEASSATDKDIRYDQYAVPEDRNDTVTQEWVNDDVLVTAPGSFTCKSIWDDLADTNGEAGNRKDGPHERQVEIVVVEPNLIAFDLFGTVHDDDEVTTGAYVHFNLDNDNSSTNTLHAPKHPGADYGETVDPVSGEDDLYSLAMGLTPMVQQGTVTLKLGSNAKLWKDATKGSTNLVMVSGEKSWDLANAIQRNDFTILASSLSVEGVATGGSQIELKYTAPNGSAATDIVNYTLIAADCGNQPRTDSNQKGRFESAFPGLCQCEWSITDGTYPNARYNCIAWSVGENNTWYNPQDIDRDFGNPSNGTFEISDMDNFYYTKMGWDPTATRADDAEAMYYSGYHAAKKKGCGCGSQKWIMFESKCGAWERIEHLWDAVTGTTYGTPVRFYK